MTHSPTTTTSTTSVARRTERNADERSDNELLAAYAAGDSRAFGEFTRRHHAFVVAVAARRIGAEHWHDAQDAAAETWIAIMGKAAALGPDGVGDVKSWLASFVRNRAVRISADYSRRQTSSHDPHVLGRVISEQGYQLPGAATPTPDDRDDREGPEGRDGWEARADMLADRFARALAALPALQRDVMTYRLHERDLTARQIAAELGRTLDSVKGAERAGRQNLRRALGDLVADAPAEEQTVGEQAVGEQAVGEQATADPLHGLTARRLLLVERLRENPTMGGPEAKTVLEQAGLGPLSARAARKVLTKARATLAKLDHPDTPEATDAAGATAASGQDEPAEPAAEPAPKPAPKPAQLRAARLLLLTSRVRETPSMTGIAARDALCEAGLGPIAGRTTRRLLNQARAQTGGTGPAS